VAPPLKKLLNDIIVQEFLFVMNKYYNGFVKLT